VFKQQVLGLTPLVNSLAFITQLDLVSVVIVWPCLDENDGSTCFGTIIIETAFSNHRVYLLKFLYHILCANSIDLLHSPLAKKEPSKEKPNEEVKVRS